MQVDNASTWAPDEIGEVAKCQKSLIRLILLQICSIPLMFIASAICYTGQSETGFLELLILVAVNAIVVLSVCGVYRMALALRKGIPIIYALVMLLSCVNLIVLLILKSQATQILRANSIRVGVMGANAEDVERVMSQTNTLS